MGKKDGRIRVIHKKNAVLGEARNSGIDSATGQYLCFFDSDDYIRLDTINTAVTSACNNSAELVIWGWGKTGKESSIQHAFYRLRRNTIAETKFRAISCLI